MTRGTTPTCIFRVKKQGLDLSQYTNYITFSQKDGMELTLTGDSVVASYDTETELTTLTVYMTQEQTLAFDSKKDAEVQLRSINVEGVALASKIVAVPVNRILLNGVISYA